MENKIKYKVEILFGSPKIKIDEVEIERETDSSVWINGQRYVKGWSLSFFDTWEDAYEMIMDLKIRKIDALIRDLKQEKALLKDVLRLKKP